MAPPCKRCRELNESVSDVLSKLVELTTAQLSAYQNRDIREFMRLDKELELTVGSKERSIGALREHESEHGRAF